jgi:plasmid stabilization system protein ParE
MPIIDYSARASLELDEITDYYLRVTDEETTVKVMTAILTEITYLADSPMLGKRIANEAPQYRVWIILKDRFKIYFERIAPDHIRVFRVYGARRKPLNPQEVFK